MPQNAPKIMFFGFTKNLVHRCKRFFWVQIMHHILVKVLISHVIAQNILDQLHCRKFCGQFPGFVSGKFPKKLNIFFKTHYLQFQQLHHWWWLLFPTQPFWPFWSFGYGTIKVKSFLKGFPQISNMFETNW